MTDRRDPSERQPVPRASASRTSTRLSVLWIEQYLSIISVIDKASLNMDMTFLMLQTSLCSLTYLLLIFRVVILDGIGNTQGSGHLYSGGRPEPPTLLGFFDVQDALRALLAELKTNTSTTSSSPQRSVLILTRPT